MTGWLVVNGFITTESFFVLWDMLDSAAKKQGVELIRKKNTDIWFELGLKDNDPIGTFTELPDFIIFWDKDMKLARILEETGVPIFNSPEAIAVCDDKAETYLALRKAGIRQPKTFISAKQYWTCEDYSYYKKAANEIGYPVILKEVNGSFGSQVYLANNDIELEKHIDYIVERGFIIQEYIDADHNGARDVRIQMVGDRCVAAMLRTNDNDYRANFSNGGQVQAYTPTAAQLDMAKKVMKALNLDFAGVDILFGENDEPILCEANSNAQFIGLKSCTGVDVAEHIIRYILTRIN